MPQARKSKCDSYLNQGDKILSIYSYWLLRYALNKDFGIQQFTFYFNEYGKPFLENQNVYFNISHCKNAIVCVLSENEIGIDMEEELIYDKGIADLICNENEKRMLKHTKKIDSLFTNFWTSKECVLKHNGGHRDAIEFMKTANLQKVKYFCFYKLHISICTNIDDDVKFFYCKG